MQELHFVAKVFGQLSRVELERTGQVKETEIVQVGAHGKKRVLVARTVRWTFVAIDRPLTLPAVLVDGQGVDRCETTNHSDWSTEKQSRKHLQQQKNAFAQVRSITWDEEEEDEQIQFFFLLRIIKFRELEANRKIGQSRLFWH